MEANNMAAMREALEAIDRNTDLLDIAENIAPKLHPSHSFVAVQIRKIIRAALAAPPRNCDIYDSYGDAIRAFEDDENAENYEEMAEWLFAPATAKEGGSK